ncbi:MAG: serine hydrolase [Marinobacter sp.]|uniref:serine hydrolase domain-containing protein n=1 Tax=Marinobacter sp. TaxID=50741 RepID=UPI0034A0A5A8
MPLIHIRFVVSLLTAVLIALAAPASGKTIEAPLDALGLSALAERPAYLDRLHALLVAVDGEPVLAYVYEGPGMNAPVNIKSLSKTVLSAVAGIAIEKGVLDSEDQRLADLLAIPAGVDEQVNDITVGHLLSMQAGLGRTSGRHYGAWVSSDNWVDYALRRPFADKPGGAMLYSTGSYHLLGAALVQVTDQNLLTLTRQWLGQPLDADIPSWPTDPQGIHFGGNDMRMSPSALLALGELYRNGGVYNGERLLSEAWIRNAWTPRGKSRYTNDDYGYGWFVTELSGYRGYYGRGYGGQMLYVIPELALTVVMTADPSPPASPSFMRKQNRLMESILIPAVEAAR